MIKENNGDSFLQSNEEIYNKAHFVEIDIINEETIEIKESFVIQNNSSFILENISLWINQSLDSLSVFDIEGQMFYDWNPISNASHLVAVQLRNNLTENESTSFTIAYDLKISLPLINDEIDYYFFEFIPTFNYFTSIFSISVILPQNSYIHEATNGELNPYFPQNPSQTIENRRIILSWEITDIDSTASPFFFVRFDEPYIITENEGFFQKSFNLFISGLLLGVFLGISGTSWMARYRERKAKKQMGRSLLDENQKELIKVIFDNGGKISQRDLCVVTGFSKSKISRNLGPLEKRGLIKREKWGRTYVVHLTDTGRAVIA